MTLAHYLGNLEFLIGLLTGFGLGVGIVTFGLIVIYLVDW